MAVVHRPLIFRFVSNGSLALRRDYDGREKLQFFALGYDVSGRAILATGTSQQAKKRVAVFSCR